MFLLNFIKKSIGSKMQKEWGNDKKTHIKALMNQYYFPYTSKKMECNKMNKTTQNIIISGIQC